MTTKINHTEKNLNVASAILEFLTNDDDDGRRDPVISVRGGELMFYNRACGIGDDETVIVERLEMDSFGDGWSDADPFAIIDYINQI